MLISPDQHYKPASEYNRLFIFTRQPQRVKQMPDLVTFF